MRVLGFDLLERHFHSPVPQPEDLSEVKWNQPSKLFGLSINALDQFDLLESQLEPWVAEFNLRQEQSTDNRAFPLHNDGYESVDAEVLYAMIRHFKPRRVVELGSGYSTILIGTAAKQNIQDNSPVNYSVFDPFPSPDLESAAPNVYQLHRTKATHVPMETFEALEMNDILFVDTTHTVKVGGDVNHVVLDVLPLLKPGVIVHFHDIFLPWEYPREWVEHRRFYWAEQYLLQAFLAFNHNFEVLFAAQVVAREFPQRLTEMIPSFTPKVSPGAFWIRRSSAS